MICKLNIFKARFPLTNRLTRLNPIAESGTDLVGSGCAVGTVCLSRHESGCYPKVFDMSKYSCSGRVVKWSGRDHVFLKTKGRSINQFD